MCSRFKTGIEKVPICRSQIVQIPIVSRRGNTGVPESSQDIILEHMFRAPQLDPTHLGKRLNIAHIHNIKNK